jgi:hypothetical protein
LSSQFTTLVRRLPISVFSVSAFQIRRYFSSGWAFLIPYIAAYLLYYLLKWPVNPATDASGASSLALGTWNLVPSLLCVYWFLHSINVVLAAVALVSWWRANCRSVLARDAEKGEFPQEDAELEDKFQIPSSKFQGTDTEILQKEVETEVAPLSSLPPVKSLQEDPGRRVSAFSLQPSALASAEPELSAPTARIRQLSDQLTTDYTDHLEIRIGPSSAFRLQLRPPPKIRTISAPKSS